MQTKLAESDIKKQMEQMTKLESYYYVQEKHNAHDKMVQKQPDEVLNIDMMPNSILEALMLQAQA